MHLLDSNICIGILNGDLQIRQGMKTLGVKVVGLPAVVLGELAYGAWKSQNPSRALAKIQDLKGDYPVIGFDEECAIQYGRIRAELQRAGLLIGANDLLIAATALAHNSTLVTRKVREFSRVLGLRIETF